MLTISLERAMEPGYMREQPCGVCGATFTPDAVLACLVTPHEWPPVCEVCLKHLATRAEEEAIPAAWDEVYRRYLAAVAKYPGPVFASEEELEGADPTSREVRAWSLVDV